MNEQLEVQGARLQRVEGRLRVSALPDPGAGSDGATGKWGTLYVVSHVLAAGPGAERIRDRVEAVAEESYRRAPGGVTNRLRQAVRNANRYMYLRNRVRGERQALFAALGCAAVRGSDVYACGVGPHSIFVLSQGRVRSYVNHVSRMGQDHHETWAHNGHMLGRSPAISDPKFSYRQIAPGELVLIVAGEETDSFERAVSELSGLLGGNDAGTVASQLGDLLGAEIQGSALLLRVLPQGMRRMDTSTAMPKGTKTREVSSLWSSARPWKRRGEGIADRRDAQPLGDPVGRGDANAPTLGALMAEQRSARIGNAGTYLQHDSGRTRARSQPSQVVQRGAETGRLGATVAASLLMGLLVGCLGMLRSAGGRVKRSWGWVRSHRIPERMAKGLGLAVVGLWAAVKGLVMGILPERQGGSKTYAAAARPMVRSKVLVFHPSGRMRVLIGGLILAGVVVLVGTSVMRIKDRLAQADAETVAVEVEERLSLAAAEDETEAKMELLAEAQGLLDQAPEGQMSAPALVQLNRELAEQWDGLTGAIRLPLRQELVWSAPEQAAQRVLLHEDHVYVVDEAGQFVYQYALDAQGLVLPDLEPSRWELPGQEEGLSAEQIVDVEWVEAGNGRLTPALLILTTDGSILELGESGSLRSVGVSQLLSWEDPQALGTYSGNLYVLDPAYGNIIKYVPNGDDYQHDPVDYVQAASDLSWPGAIDMAIDGCIYVLLSDGSILKFAGGQAQPFTQEGVYPPLEEPLGISASPDSTSVFVADSSEGRIVEFTPEGQFVRQYRASLDGEDYFGEMTAFAVDVSRGRVLVGTASGLYSASLPSLE
jgi:hypothetical protein